MITLASAETFFWILSRFLVTVLSLQYFLEMLDFFWKDDGGRSSFCFMIAYVAEGHIAAKYF